MDVFEKFSSVSPTPTLNRLNLSSQSLRRFLEKIEIQNSGCWLWTASKSVGYGQIRMAEIDPRRPVHAHIVSYRLSVGDIPPGYQLHHKTEDGCIGSACVNPAHLECVTPSRHIDLTPLCPTAINRARTSCIRGHEFTPENTRIVKDGTGRSCIACEKIRETERTARRSTGRPSGRPQGTHCGKGHPLSGENLYLGPISKRDGTPYRGCRACRNERSLEFIQRNHERVLAAKRSRRERDRIQKAKDFYNQFV